MVNHSRTSPSNLDPSTSRAPFRSERKDRLRTFARKAIGTTAVLAAAGGAIFGLSQLSKAHSGPAYDKKTEDGIERVIKPEMNRIASEAIKLAAAPNSKMVTMQEGKGITEISGFTSDSNEIMDVVMRDYPGTHKPNPKAVLATDIQLNLNPGNDDPKGGVFADNEIAFLAPGSAKYLTEGNATSIYAVDKEGWTAIDSGIKGKGESVDDLISGTIDTADSTHFAVDDNFNSVGPIGTAKDAAADAKDMLPPIVDSLK